MDKKLGYMFGQKKKKKDKQKKVSQLKKNYT